MSSDIREAADTTLGIRLLLDRISRDSVGWSAHFVGLVVGERIIAPITEEHAKRLKVGSHYVFALVREES